MERSGSHDNTETGGKTVRSSAAELMYSTVHIEQERGSFMNRNTDTNDMRQSSEQNNLTSSLVVCT
jgi:hypothetical protein